ncbi:MAG: aquaporin, partial [Pseudomonadota bacterium]
MAQLADKPLHGQPVPHDRLHPRLYAAEAAGTALLVFCGLSVVILIFGEGSVIARWLPDAALRRCIAGGLFGTVGALITISPLGRLSGAHINPSVSFAFWLEGKLKWRDLVGYVLAQMGGAVIGALPLLWWGSMGRSVQFGTTLVGIAGTWAALGGEIFATTALVLVIFICAAHVRSRPCTPWTIPPLFALLVCFEGPLSGASTNLARSFGPALVTGDWQGFWIYVAGPLAGALLAVGLLKLGISGPHRVRVARLAHFAVE